MIKSIFNLKFSISKNPSLTLFVFLFLLSTFYLLLSTFALAHTEGLWRPGQPIVPCGKVNTCDADSGKCRLTPTETCTEDSGCTQEVACTKCQLWHLLKHLIDFIMVAVAPILATLFFIVAGVYIMLGGANPGMLSTGKRIFKDTFIGLLMVMLSWLIVNTLIQSLKDPRATCNNNVCSNGAGPCTEDSQCGLERAWWEYSCSE